MFHKLKSENEFKKNHVILLQEKLILVRRIQRKTPRHWLILKYKTFQQAIKHLSNFGVFMYISKGGSLPWAQAIQFNGASISTGLHVDAICRKEEKQVIKFVLMT